MNKEIIDCRVDLKDANNRRFDMKVRPVTVILNDNIVQVIDYILATYNDLEKLKSLYKVELIELLNRIYTEHIKLTLLGLNYPKYELTLTNKSDMDCQLLGFGNPDEVVKSYKVTNFTTSIYLDLDFCNIRELILTKPIYANFIQGYIKIIGIENIKVITDTNLSVICKNIEKQQDKTLVMKYLEHCDIYYNRVEGIEKIILEDTCTIENISLNLLMSMPTLKEIQLCKSIESINLKPVLEVLKKDTTDGNYYIEVNDKTMWDRRDKIRRIKVTWSNN